MRPLHRMQDHRHLVEAIELAVETQFVRCETLKQHLECFVVHRLRLREIERVIRGFERRHAASDAKFESSAAQLIEHADFLDQAQRVIERQQIDHRTEAQPRGALRHGGEKQAGRRRAAKRRAVMLGEMIGVKAGSLVSLSELEASGIEFAERNAGIVQVIEDAEFHDGVPPSRHSGRAQRKPGIHNHGTGGI